MGETRQGLLKVYFSQEDVFSREPVMVTKRKVSEHASRTTCRFAVQPISGKVKVSKTVVKETLAVRQFSK